MQTKNQRNRNRQKQSENDEISNKKGAYEHSINSLKLLSISVRQEQNKITVLIIQNPNTPDIYTDGV